ncbi:MAG: hypothetical protein WB626_09300 [Bacteroidota bacterium]
MFPILTESTKDLEPECYWGGEEVPPYLHSPLPAGCSTDEMIGYVRAASIGSDICGYIDGEGIHFHLANGGIVVDLSRELGFISFPRTLGAHNPTAWQVLRFLQDRVRRFLLVGLGGAILLEKTPACYALCRKLDGIWADLKFFKGVMELIEKELYRQRTLALLMKHYERTSGAEPTEMWEFWDTFGPALMTERLFLRVEHY